MNILRRGRLGNSIKEDVAKYTTSLDFDKEIFEADILCDIAHVIMLYEQGIIKKEDAKKIVKKIKDLKLKVQASIRGEEVRVVGKNIDDLQTAIKALKEADLEVPLNFINMK